MGGKGTWCGGREEGEKMIVRSDTVQSLFICKGGAIGEGVEV